MFNKISGWGMGAVIVYIVGVIWLFIYATNCVGDFCGLTALLAGMPWFLILDIFGGDSYTSGLFGWVSIILNIVFLYLIFSQLQKHIQRK